MFSKVIDDGSNPLTREEAQEGFEKISKNGWRVWVEHHKTGVRIFENHLELQYKDK